MEENQYYKSIQSIVYKLDARLQSIVELQLKKDFSLKRREIEEHFERAIHELEAREQVLLAQLDLISQQQDSLFHNLNTNLNERREKCKEIEQAGAIAYKHSKVSADLIWQEALKLEGGPTDTSALQLRVTVDLPTELLENINTHGKVESAVDPNYDAMFIPMTNSTNVIPPSITTTINTNVGVTTKALRLVGNSSIFAGSTQGYANGTGDKAKFDTPLGICCNLNDSCLYVCDTVNHAIRRITIYDSVVKLGTVSTLTGRGIFQKFPEPVRIAQKQTENIFYVTCDHGFVCIDMKGNFSFVVGNNEKGDKDSTGKDASFNWPNGIAVNKGNGITYIGDSRNCKIRRVTPNGDVSTLAGSTQGYEDGSGTVAKFFGSRGMCVDEKDQSILYCDNGNSKIRKITEDGNVSTVCHLLNPRDITIVNDTILALTDTHLYTIQKQADGKYTATQLENFFSKSLAGMAVHEPTRSIFMTDRALHTIIKISYEFC